MYFEKEFTDAISDSFAKYKAYGARSTQKLRPLHKYVGFLLEKIWGEDFHVDFLNDATREITVIGKYYPKDIDIVVGQKDKAIFCVGIKFVTSNYKQNANNYFESMMGETANIQAALIPYAHLIVLRYRTPYYKKNETIKAEKTEIINEKDLSKYLKLTIDSQQSHRPASIGIILVDIDEASHIVSVINPHDVFNKNFAEAFENNLSISTFVRTIENYKKAYIVTHQ